MPKKGMSGRWENLDAAHVIGKLKARVYWPVEQKKPFHFGVEFTQAVEDLKAKLPDPF